ncbi:hypothetical protein PLANTIT3_100003 [Plantibacter sp. T3]|nr:hypothetical protein PLANTIT3_100003 [Plantibacter sp. T3]
MLRSMGSGHFRYPNAQMAGAHGLGQAVPAHATGRSAAMGLPLRLPPPRSSNRVRHAQGTGWYRSLSLSKCATDDPSISSGTEGALRDRGKHSGTGGSTQGTEGK